MMKVLQISAYAAPYEGNFIRALFFLEKELLQKGIQTIYCFPETAKETEWGKDMVKSKTVYFLPLSRARIRIATYVKLRRIFARHPEICIVHSHFELYDVPVSLTAPKHVKVFWHLHDAMGNYLHGINKYIWKIQYSVFSKRASLVSVSKKHMRVVIGLGFNEKRAYYVPNGIDTLRIQKVDMVNDNNIVDYLVFGWDYYRKGVDVAIEATKDLRGQVSLGIVGNTHCVEINNQEYIKNIEPTDNVSELYSKIACFLHVSRAEGLSYALLEALYAGLPVIVSDIEENLFAKSMPTAFFVPVGNSRELARVMSDLKDGRIIVNSFDIDKTREIIENNYSLEAWTKSIYDLYFN